MKLNESIYKIKYREMTQLWRPIWAKQVRGTIVYRNSETGIIQVLKYLLPRGAEIAYKKQIPVTNSKQLMNKLNTINTSSEVKRYGLDEPQLETARILQDHSQELTLPGFLSFKNDGSLCGITVFDFDSEAGKIWKAIAISEREKNPFGLALLEYCESKNYKYGIVFSSQDTVFCDYKMLSYYISSCVSALNYFSTEELDFLTLLIQANNKISWEKVILVYLEKFIDSLIEFTTNFITIKITNTNSKDYDSNNSSSILPLSLSFEAICANRTCLLGIKHTELAISYPVGMFRFLGVSQNLWKNIDKIKKEKDSLLEFIPHCALSDSKVLLPKIWDEPLWWETKSNTQVRSMIEHLELCLDPNSGWTEEKWLKEYPPANTRSPHHHYFDYEGFVYYSAKPQLVYSKIKTKIYYQAHNVKVENIKLLLQASSSKAASEFFPVIGNLKSFFTGLLSPLQEIGTVIHQRALDIISNSEKLDPVVIQMNPKAQIALFKQTKFEVQCKMILNSQSSLWNVFLLELFNQYFPALKNINEENKEIKEQIINPVEFIVKNITNLIMFWLPETERTKHIQQLTESSELGAKHLGELFLLCNKNNNQYNNFTLNV